MAGICEPRPCSALCFVLLAFGVAGCGFSSRYAHEDVLELARIEPVERPLARELVTQVRWEANHPASPDPYVDAPSSPDPSPIGIVKTGPDLGPIAGRPHYQFRVFTEPPLDRPTVPEEFSFIDRRVQNGTSSGSVLTERSYEAMSKEEIAAVHAWERSFAAVGVLTSTLAAAAAAAREAERSTRLSDATLRRRMILESGAIGEDAPEGTRLALYYQIVFTDRGRNGAYNQYFGCLAQLQHVDPDGSMTIVDGEAFGYHVVAWRGDPPSGHPPKEYLSPAEVGDADRIHNDKNPMTRFENPLWQLAYRSCRVAVRRLSARRAA